VNRRSLTVSAVATGVAAAVLFVWSWLYRFNDLDGSLAGLSDDHYFYLVRGWQLLYGEWPDRDFVDPGAPLTFGLAALTQIVGGRGTWSEIVFCVTALSTATALTFWAARRASGSIAIGALAALLQAALLPRYYSYPKVLIYAVALPLLWSYVDQPTTRKRIGLAAWSVAALLFRHDHGLFVGLAVVATIACQSHLGWFARLKHLAAYIALTVAMAAPYLGYLQVYGGVMTHVTSANSWAARDRARAPLVLPAFGLSPRDGEDPVVDEGDWWQRGVFVQASRNFEPWLFWLIVSLPLVTLTTQCRRSEPRTDWPYARQKLLVASLLGCVLAWAFLRGNLAVRVGDVSVTTAILGAWLLRLVLVSLGEGRSFLVRLATVSVALTVLAGTVFVLLPPVRERLDHVGMTDRPLGAFDKAIAMTGRLTTWPLEAWVSADEPGPTRLVFYIRECTEDEDRVFISPYLAQVHALAPRAFPGGHADLRPGFFSTPADQRLALARLMEQRVPLAIMPAGDDYEGVRKEMPRIDAWLRTEFREHGDVKLGDGSRVKLFARLDRPSSGSFRETDWPCFR
jgi:hypothetical protein